jgi:blue copper oxidase
LKKAKTFRRILLPVTFLLITTVAFTQPKFINKIPIPYLVDSTTTDDTLKLVMHNAAQKFNPGNPADSALNGTAQQRLDPDTLRHGLKVSVYNQKDSVGKKGALRFLGPTLVWHTSATDYTYLQVKNDLPDASTTHWHGAEIPAIMDGGPHQVIDKGATWKPYFINLDHTSTLWYHPHLHDYTIQQVSHGLSGLVFSKDRSDDIADLFPRTYGVDDIPLIIGDLGTQKVTVKSSPCNPCDTNYYKIVEQKGSRPFNIVNGVTNPYLEVPRAWVRLRILNGSSRKGIQFGFSNAYDSLGKIPFTLIATDGGYTINTDNISDTLHTLLTGPGSRNEILLDLTNFAGDTIWMSNMKNLLDSSIVGSPYPPPTPGGGGQDATKGGAFLQLRLKAPSFFPNYTPVTSIPQYKTYWAPEVSDTLGVNRRREKKLILTTVSVPNGNGGTTTENLFTIDNTDYKMEVINDTVCVGAKEIWTINNLSPIAHPFHIHKVFFRVLDIKDKNGNFVDLHKYGLIGPKDDVMVLPGWKLRFITKFDDYPSPINPHLCYMYHCHILTHEDAVGGGMMHQFVVTEDTRCILPQLAAPAEMTLFPNPTSGELFLGGFSFQPSTVQIFNLLGQLIRKEVLAPFVGSTLINVDGINAGLYFVRWNNTKGQFAQKLTIFR